MTTICFTYFRSLSLANLAAALYSVRKQNLTCVESVVIIDNNTNDSSEAIQAIVDELAFPVPVRVLSYKHGDQTKTHAWSTNTAVRAAHTPWVFFTRADYLLAFDLLERFLQILADKGHGWNGFVTGHVYHLNVGIHECEQTAWRTQGPGVLCALNGTEADYTAIDSGVWMARTMAFHMVGGLDERLTAWGHAQTHFQYKLHQIGVEVERIRKPLFFHPQHDAPRDLGLASQQLRMFGIDLKELWARHDGARVY